MQTQMTSISKKGFLFLVRNYIQLTKPGIIMGNCMTAFAGFALASYGQFLWGIFLTMIFGVSFVIASACMCNNYIDREIDKKMKRTKNRVLPKGLIPAKLSLVLAVFLGISGISLLGFFINPLTASLAFVGFVVYVFLYSLLKYHTLHFTLIGSIAGSMPPLVGYCSLTNTLDLKALILFLIVATWQMPHFFAIALYRLEDYQVAKIPVLPVIKGIHKTKWQMFFYILAFMASTSLLTIFRFTGYGFLLVLSSFGIAWASICLKGFKAKSDVTWARQMFAFSLVVITAFCLMIPLGVV